MLRCGVQLLPHRLHAAVHVDLGQWRSHHSLTLPVALQWRSYCHHPRVDHRRDWTEALNGQRRWCRHSVAVRTVVEDEMRISEMGTYFLPAANGTTHADSDM